MRIISGTAVAKLQFVCAGKFRVGVAQILQSVCRLQFVCAGKFRAVSGSPARLACYSCNSYAQVSFEFIYENNKSMSDAVAIRMRR